LNELTAALSWMLESAERRRQIGAANREKMCAHYAWQHVITEYERRCYEPALAQARAAEVAELDSVRS
jgi:hypothetical protein